MRGRGIQSYMNCRVHFAVHNIRTVDRPCKFDSVWELLLLKKLEDSFLDSICSGLLILSP